MAEASAQIKPSAGSKSASANTSKTPNKGLTHTSGASRATAQDLAPSSGLLKVADQFKDQSPVKVNPLNFSSTSDRSLASFISANPSTMAASFSKLGSGLEFAIVREKQHLASKASVTGYTFSYNIPKEGKPNAQEPNKNRDQKGNNKNSHQAPVPQGKTHDLKGSLYSLTDNHVKNDAQHSNEKAPKRSWFSWLIDKLASVFNTIKTGLIKLS